MEKTIDLKFQLTKEDYWNFNKRHIRNGFTLRSKIIIAAGFILWFILMWQVLEVSFIFLLFFFPFFVVGMVYAIFFGIKRRLMKLLAESKLTYIQQHYIISDKGVRYENEIGKGRYAWDKFVKAIDSQDTIALYFSKIQALIIPKRILNNKQKKFILSLINRNI